MARRRPHLTRPPTQPGGLNLDDPFVASLGLIQLTYGGLNWDFAAERPYQLMGPPPTDTAETSDFTATSSGRIRPAGVKEKTQSFTVGLQVKLLGTSTSYSSLIGMMYDTAGNSPYGDQIDLSGGVQKLRFAYNANGSALAIAATASISSTQYDWVFATFAPGYQALYLNGVLMAEGHDAGALSYTATSSIVLGNGLADGRIPNASIKTALRCDHVITSAEMGTIMANQYRLARNPQRAPAVRRLLSGPTYTFVVATGGLVLSAANVRMTALRRLAAATSAYVLSGAAAGLTTARRLLTSSGVFSLSGAAGALKAARRLPVAVGTVGLTGAAANLIAARRLAAPPATFAFAGGSVNFTYAPIPGGQGPTYTLTGGAGAYLLSATAARLLLARRMVAAAGAFSAAGAPVALLAARRLPVGAAAFAAAGTAVGLRAARRLPASAVSFSLGGSTATFFYTPIGGPTGPTYTLTAIGGALGLTGAGVGLRVGRRLAAGAGQFVFTGGAANMAYGQRVVYVRAPDGPGYTSQHQETQRRSAATQRNNR